MTKVHARDAIQELVGNRVVTATDDTLTLSNGVRLRFDTENGDCCAWVNLNALHTVDNIITAASIEVEYDDTHESRFKARVQVVTEDQQIANVAEASGDETSGYYIHGFDLRVEVLR